MKRTFLTYFLIHLHFSPYFTIVSRTYRKSISIECAERFSPDKSSLSLFGKLLTIVVGWLFPRRNIKQIEHDHSQTDYLGCKRNFITWLDDIRGLSNSVRMMDYRFRGTKFILNEYLVARDELSIHTRDIAGYLLYVGVRCTVARNDR